jgi:hypothetical protein
MKTTVKLSVIRSLIVLASCLALSQVVQAKPKFHGTLTASINDSIMVMGDMVMLMGFGTETITHSDGDFAVLGVKRGDTVTLDGSMPGMMMMTMLMPGMGAPGLPGFTISSVPGWMLMGIGPATFSSSGLGDLQITATGMTMVGGYPMTDATLTFAFFTDEDGSVRGSITLTASPQ